MELPICTGTYSSEFDVSEVDFLNNIQLFFDEYKLCYVPFCVGACYACRDIERPERVLQQCGGCQLVSYCNKSCQKSIWAIHKVVCKEFPVVNGKNVLHTTGSWKKHIAGLRERIANFPDHAGNAARIFRNPRVCHTCRKARPDHLFNCKNCRCVSYCSKQCAKADKSHKEHCLTLVKMMFLQGSIFKNVSDHLPSLRIESVCEKFTMLPCEWSEILPFNVFETICDSTVGFGLVVERLVYPMSLLYALQMVPECRLGSEHCPLKDLTTLTVHVINNSPLFDSEPWEFFMHQLPKLNQLKVVYVMQGKAFKQHSIHINLLSNLSLLRCDDCKVKNRVITYSVQQKHYHMYFSSEEYTEPDVVVIFGNTYEMSASDEVEVHSEISYRNMTHSRYTVLVLMDDTEELVRQGVRAVNAARPVDQLVLPQKNPLRGSGSDRADIDLNTAIINDRHYFTCLRSK